MSDFNVTWTLGSILVGSFFAVFLSGTVTMQLFFYLTAYTTDPLKIQLVVSAVWLLDFLHTVFICAANWHYFIAHWGDNAIHDDVPWTLAASIALTATVTWLVQCFFAYRVFTVSRRNAWITSPILILAFARIVVGLTTTTELVRYGSFSEYRERCGWLFATGLSMSSALDILVTTSLCYYLRQGRTGFISMDAIINTLTFYTIQNGLCTGIVTIAALICWFPLSNLVPFGIHLTITKLYANASLATLNARRSLHNHPVLIEVPRSGPYSEMEQRTTGSTTVVPAKVRSAADADPPPIRISVEQKVRTVDELEPPSPSSSDPHPV